MRIANLLAYIFVASVITVAAVAAIGVGIHLQDPQMFVGALPIGALMGLGALSMWQDIGRALGHLRQGQPVSFDW